MFLSGPRRLESLSPNPSNPLTVSVVISTYQRPDACERALGSVLEQTEAPLEVLIVDDGSSDDTEARMRAWEARDARVRYLRSPHNSGTPATTRNLGIRHASGELIAFLDDDDEWLPSKLAAQLAILASEDADIVATNAVRSDGRLYFPDASPVWSPTSLDIIRTNPVIMSSALARREQLLSTPGFPTDAWVRGCEDYAMWLELASMGARFIVLGESLVRYEDGAEDRLSRERARIQAGVARLAWRHALRAPRSRVGVYAALKYSIGIGYVIAEDALASIAARRRERLEQPIGGSAGS